MLTVEPTLHPTPPPSKHFLNTALENAELRDWGYSLVFSSLPSMHRALGLILSTHEPGMFVYSYKSSPGDAGAEHKFEAILSYTVSLKLIWGTSV